MTPEENLVLKDLGDAALQHVEAMTVYVLFFGMSILLFGASVSTAIRRGFSSKLTIFFFVLTIITFILFTLHVGAEIGGSIAFFRRAFVEHVDLSLFEGRSRAIQATETAGLVAFWAINLIRLINDLVIIWRAWALVQVRRWVIILPFALWLTTFGMSFADLGYVSSSWGFTNYHEGTYEDTFFPTTLILSVTTNLLATLMIAFQLWKHRSFVAKTFSSSTRKSTIRQMLILLVESGFIYATLQITYMALTFQTTYMAYLQRRNFAAVYSYLDINLALSALLPTIMMLIVQRRHSMADVYGFNTARDPNEETPHVGNGVI